MRLSRRREPDRPWQKRASGRRGMRTLDSDQQYPSPAAEAWAAFKPLVDASGDWQVSHDDFMRRLIAERNIDKRPEILIAQVMDLGTVGCIVRMRLYANTEDS